MAESKLLSLLQKFFNLKPGESLPQASAFYSMTPDSFAQSVSPYIDYWQEDRKARYYDYDSMDSFADISIALDVYAEEATQRSFEEKEKTVWVTSEDPEVVSICNRLFEDLDIENLIFGMARHLAKYGDLFAFPIIDLDDEERRVIELDSDTPSDEMVDDEEGDSENPFQKDGEDDEAGDGGDDEESEEEAEDVDPSEEDDSEEEDDDEESDTESDSDEEDDDEDAKKESINEDFINKTVKKNQKFRMVKLIFLHPTNVDVVSDPNTGKTIGYNCDSLEVETTITNRYQEKPPPRSLTDKEDIGFTLWDFIHFKIVGSNINSDYGASMLEASRRDWQTLSMLETALALFRLNRAGAKVVYYIDVGSATPSEALSIVNNWIKLSRGQRYLDIEDPANAGRRTVGSLTEYMQKWEPFGMNRDIYWPVSENSESKIDTFNFTPDVNAIEDIIYFQGKVRGALGIPKAYFDQDISGWNANKSLAQQDIRFSKKVERLQRAIIEGIQTLCAINLFYNGIEEFSFSVKMEPPSSLELLQRIEILQSKVGISSELMGVASTFGFNPETWGDYVLKNVLELSSDEIKKFKKGAPSPLPPVMYPTDVADISGLYGVDQNPALAGGLDADMAPLGAAGQDKGFTSTSMEGFRRRKTPKRVRIIEDIRLDPYIKSRRKEG